MLLYNIHSTIAQNMRIVKFLWRGTILFPCPGGVFSFVVNWIFYLLQNWAGGGIFHLSNTEITKGIFYVITG